MKDLLERKYVRDIPYEGTEIDLDGIETFIINLLKDFVSYSHRFTKTDKGYLLGKVYHSREDIIRMYIAQLNFK